MKETQTLNLDLVSWFVLYSPGVRVFVFFFAREHSPTGLRTRGESSNLFDEKVNLYKK